MDKNLTKFTKNDTNQINNHTVQYKILLHNKHNHIYNWPAFLEVNNGYTSLNALVKICY